MPLAVSITAGTIADCTEAIPLIENLKADGLIADRAYDTGEIITYSVEHYKIVVIPPKKIVKFGVIMTKKSISCVILSRMPFLI